MTDLKGVQRCRGRDEDNENKEKLIVKSKLWTSKTDDSTRAWIIVGQLDRERIREPVGLMMALRLEL